jgi:hypothetical protein
MTADRVVSEGKTFSTRMRWASASIICPSAADTCRNSAGLPGNLARYDDFEIGVRSVPINLRVLVIVVAAADVAATNAERGGVELSAGVDRHLEAAVSRLISCGYPRTLVTAAGWFG